MNNKSTPKKSIDYLKGQYLHGLSGSETIFYSEYGDYYSLLLDRKEFEEQKEKTNKSLNIE